MDVVFYSKHTFPSKYLLSTSLVPAHFLYLTILTVPCLSWSFDNSSYYHLPNTYTRLCCCPHMSSCLKNVSLIGGIIEKQSSCHNPLNFLLSVTFQPQGTMSIHPLELKINIEEFSLVQQTVMMCLFCARSCGRCWGTE